MILSLPSRLHHAPDDPAQRIDRTLDDRGHRLIAGLNVSRTFDRIDAVLMVTVGHGKYLRISHIEAESKSVPATLQESLAELSEDPRPSIAEAKQLSMDLALQQASLFETIKCAAGKYVDRILAIAVNNPGLWWEDFDGSQQYHCLSDPVRLSQITGVTVVDDFPARDIAAGGTGQCLESLPLWLMHADRSQIIAADHRLVLRLSNETTGYWLPASDGLDAELPNIRSIGPTPSVEFLESLLGRRNDIRTVESTDETKIKSLATEKLYAEGSRNSDLIEQWNRIWLAAQEQNTHDSESIPLRGGTLSAATDVDQSLAQVALETQFESLSHADVVRSAVYWLTELILAEISPAKVRADHVYFATETALTPCLINQFIQAADFDKARVQTAAPSSHSPTTKATGAISAAIHGLLHIDQMPANVPQLTGASEQRILGRLSMGKPSNWRQLLREMADFHPPAMKLRDAV